MSWRARRHWVFDMDGTLTIALHDFAAIKRQLGIAEDDDILTHLAALPAEQAAAKHAWLLQYERELAVAAQPAVGAQELIKALHQRGCQLAILTRNAHELALLTLQAIGLDQYFPAELVLGREQAAPKPAPDGLLHLSQHWNVAPHQMVMVGDYHYDLECAKAAGAFSVLVNQPINLWPQWADLYIPDCYRLLEQL